LKKLVNSAWKFILHYLDKYRWLRFGIVGGIGTLIHFAVLFSFTKLGLWYIFSAIVAVLVAATSNYILNQLWTFKENKIQRKIIGWLKYISSSSIFDGLYLLLLAFFTEVVGVWYIFSAVISVLIVFPLRYNVSRLWIWGNLRPSMVISRKHPDDADYDWDAYQNGTPIQKWWKVSITKAVWSLLPEVSNVLDIGCGSSYTLSRYKGIGIDINEDKVKFMNSHLGDDGQRVYLLGNASFLPFKDNSFDAILCIEVIEHLQIPKDIMAEIARVTKPNGKIVIATPDYSKPAAYIIDIMTPYGGYHTYRFSRRSLEKICEASGLKPLKYTYVGGCDLVALFEKRTTV
jgi:putative flippase GtrA/SAM-dependent methyltransferase